VHKRKNFILLDKGTNDGIRNDMGVIGAKGIVGKVGDVSADYALVFSVLNEIPYSIQVRGKDKYFGLLRWDGGDPLHASFADLDKHVPIHKGDTVETRGQGVFPMGTLVGVVDSVSNDPSIPFHTVRVLLSEDLTRAGYVFAVEDLTKGQRAPFDSTLAAP
jgi:rod shape-determining protein MreC